MEVRSDTDVQIVRLIWVQGRKTNRTIWLLVYTEISLRIADIQNVLSCKANDQKYWGLTVLNLFSNFEQVNINDFLIKSLNKKNEYFVDLFW